MRLILAVHMAFVTAAGPWLCCCAGAPACRAAAPRVERADECPLCRGESCRGESDRSQSPDSCPCCPCCLCHVERPVAILADGAESLKSLLDFEFVTPLRIEFAAAGLSLSGRDAGTVFVRGGRELLAFKCVMRC